MSPATSTSQPTLPCWRRRAESATSSSRPILPWRRYQRGASGLRRSNDGWFDPRCSIERRKKKRQLGVDQIDVRNPKYEIALKDDAVVQHVVDHVEERRFFQFGFGRKTWEKPVVAFRAVRR